MSRPIVNERVFKACLKTVVANTAKPYQIGLSDEDLKLLTQEENWQAADRHIVTRCLENVLYGTLQVTGFKRIEVPIEFIASAIVVSVNEVNWMAAAHMLSDVNHAEAAVNAGYEARREDCTSKKLFSMIELASASYERLNEEMNKVFKNAEMIDEQTGEVKELRA